ncbi:hypothetical protein SFMTTN_2960 [Sulfuriferula multivorans]|uniref:Uncharacterized protein n=1 Tax=Sulfuriferula multivorans TaxID=1559896 RepID=A0A401JZG7_9PROT|nr:hypothetical protein SFMTTN_2960 [Sulfuriferula multivorans]
MLSQFSACTCASPGQLAGCGLKHPCGITISPTPRASPGQLAGCGLKPAFAAFPRRVHRAHHPANWPGAD